MKKPVFECEKCKAKANGDGFSFVVSESEGILTLVASTDLEKLPEHACREEHMLQIVGDALRKMKGGKTAPEITAPGLDDIHPKVKEAEA